MESDYMSCLPVRIYRVILTRRLLGVNTTVLLDSSHAIAALCGIRVFLPTLIIAGPFPILLSLYRWAGLIENDWQNSLTL